VQKENVTLKERNEDLENQLIEKEDESIKVYGLYSEMNKAYTVKEDAYRSTIEQLNLKLSDQKGLTNNLLNRIERLEQEYEVVASNLYDSQKELHILKDENKRLTQCNQDLGITNTSLEKEISDNKTNLKLYNQNLREVEKKLEEVEKYNFILIAEKEKLERERDSFANSYQELLSQLEFMKTQFESWKGTTSILQLPKQALNEDHSKIIEELAKEVLNSQTSLSGYADQLSQLECEAETLTSILKELKNDHIPFDKEN
jgi:DNA repair exonuclease SbcCD ATPase subunit